MFFQYQLTVPCSRETLKQRLSHMLRRRLPIGRVDDESFVLYLSYGSKSFRPALRYCVRGELTGEGNATTVTYRLHAPFSALLSQALLLVIFMTGIVSLCKGAVNYGFLIVTASVLLGFSGLLLWLKNTCKTQFEQRLMK